MENGVLLRRQRDTENISEKHRVEAGDMKTCTACLRCGNSVRDGLVLGYRSNGRKVSWVSREKIFIKGLERWSQTLKKS